MPTTIGSDTSGMSFAIIFAVVVMVFGFLIGGFFKEVAKEKQVQGCDYYADTTIKNVPAKCAAHFNLTVPTK